MTREQAKKAIEVLNAYCEGKEIEVADKGIGNWGNVVSDEPRFNFASFDYRIKPTEEYRPYEDCDEMIEDFNERFRADSYVIRGGDLPLIWVKHKQTGKRQLLTSFGKTLVDMSDVNGTSVEELFKDYEYLDGTLIGKKE